MDSISEADLILNPDGSIYHLDLLPVDIAPTIILVGDPGRVKLVSDHFDEIRVVKSKREFLTHTGSYRGTPVTVLSTGIGTDNIDIVLNELDALVNVDLETRRPKEKRTALKFIRLGTSGALHQDIEVGSRIMARIACGFDNLLHYYADAEACMLPGYSEAFMRHARWPGKLSEPYFVPCSSALADAFSPRCQAAGITISSPGFYAPQVRWIRHAPFDESLIDRIRTFSHEDLRMNNFEMECSALYGLSALMGHEALTMCIAIANRASKTFLKDYQPQVKAMIADTLETLVRHE